MTVNNQFVPPFYKDIGQLTLNQSPSNRDCGGYSILWEERDVDRFNCHYSL